MDMLIKEFSEKDWEEYANCYPRTNYFVDGMPQDIVDTVIGVLGVNPGLKWLKTPITSIHNKRALELVKTIEGEKALKALIMRLPT